MKSLSLIFFTLSTIFVFTAKAAADTSDPTDLISLFKDDQKAVRVAEIADFITSIKMQIKDVIKELALQIIDDLKEIVDGIRIKLLKKFSKVTMSDVFNGVFGGVAELVQTPAHVVTSASIYSGNEDRPSIFETFQKPSLANVDNEHHSFYDIFRSSGPYLSY